jgi:hypothetical protein
MYQGPADGSGEFLPRLVNRSPALKPRLKPAAASGLPADNRSHQLLELDSHSSLPVDRLRQLGVQAMEQPKIALEIHLTVDPAPDFVLASAEMMEKCLVFR